MTPLKSAFCAILASGCAILASGCGSSNAMRPTEFDFTIPNHPHQMDIYYPDRPASSAIVFLHGGGGTKEGLAKKLAFTQEWLNANQVAIIVPQGFSLEKPVLKRPGKAYT